MNTILSNHMDGFWGEYLDSGRNIKRKKQPSLEFIKFFNSNQESNL